MKKKLLLLALVGTTTLTSLVVAGLALSNTSSFSIAAGGELVKHNLVMTTENTVVSTEAGYDCDYLNMDTYTTNGNKFGVYDSEFHTDYSIYLNTEDALFEVSETYETISLSLYICFDFNLDVDEGTNVTACMYYKLKDSVGWDEEPTMWDWDSLDAEDNYALFTFDINVSDVYGFKLISCNFTYSCSY